MFTNVPCGPHYLHGTHLSLIEFRINLLKHVDCNQVDGDYNATFQYVKILWKKRYINNVLYVTPTKKPQIVSFL